MKKLSIIIAIFLGAAAFTLTTSSFAYTKGQHVERKHTAKDPSGAKKYKTDAKGKKLLRAE